jgi:hypothetical protein
MLNFFKITTNGYQVMLEGSAFYFLKKIPIGFREKGDSRIQVSTPKHGQQFGKEGKAFVDALTLMGNVINLAPMEFAESLRVAYNSAILRGSTRSAMEKFGLKEIEDVNNQQSNVNETKNRVHRNVLLGSCRNAFRECPSGDK